ncbi:DUF4157 domain-containing protein [Streptomyces iakyrus]|uniref:eCIS core domain-containing protein n=1 Tax=Streptomyces iakyrus TaxID=68219 RepID=UPI003822530E
MGNTYLQRVVGCSGGAREPEGKESCCENCRLPDTQRAPAVGPPADVAEQEADRVAGFVAARPEPVGGPDAAGHPPPVIRRLSSGPGAADGGQHDAPLPVGGRPLSNPVLAFMEARFRQDFGDVRVHSDPDTHRLADRLQARAFTSGVHIYLGKGESEHDHWLMAHELTHVVQQREGAAAGIVRRAPAPDTVEIERLLSYGLLDWAITDDDAVRALNLVKALPRFQQAAFFAKPALAERLRDNLPKNRVPEWGALAAEAAGIRAPAAIEEDIDLKLSHSLVDWAVSPQEAVEVLVLLNTLSTPRLATTLYAIDYDRLMTALPAGRKMELAQLRVRAWGVGGARQTEEEEHPGIFLRAITFRSDHGMLTDNETDWTSRGQPYGEPEWSIDKGKAVTRPISQTRGTRVTAELGMTVLPANAPPTPVRLTGRSTEPSLNFEYSGSLRGGPNQALLLTSGAALPDTVTALEGRRIVWSVDWRGWRHEVARSLHTVYVTAGTPLVPDEVTHKRMSTAVAVVGAVAGSVGLDPHLLVAGLMRRWSRYNLDVPLGNPWELADDERGGQCITITNFVQALLWTIGSPGTAVSVVVWARPGNPRVPVESPWPHGGLRTAGGHPKHPTWIPGLVDARGCPNSFEAALRFDHGGVRRYYPGGVRAIRGFTTAEDVLFVFSCFAWLTPVEHKLWVVQAIETTYPRGWCQRGPMRCQ